MSRPLPESFYARATLTVARELLGKRLRRGPVTLEITEVEAYPPGDTAAHSRHGRTERNAPMWGPPGRAYVYLCYGMHQMLNVVTEPDGVGAAVLIRACRPVRGLATIRARRNGLEGPALLTGPGKVGSALALDGTHNHRPLFRTAAGVGAPRPPLVLVEGERPATIVEGPRVGIDYAATEHRQAAWRFAIGATPWVSHRKGLA